MASQLVQSNDVFAVWGTSLRYRGAVEQAKTLFLQALQCSQLSNSLDEQLSSLISLTSVSREAEEELDRAAYLQRALSLHFRHQPHLELPERLQLELIYDQMLSQAENSSATSRLPGLLESLSFPIRSEAGFIDASLQLMQGNSHRLIGVFLDAKFHELRQAGLYSLMFRLLEQYVTRQLHSRQWFAAIQTLQLGQRLAFDCHFPDKLKQLKTWENRLQLS